MNDARIIILVTLCLCFTACSGRAASNINPPPPQDGDLASSTAGEPTRRATTAPPQYTPTPNEKTPTLKPTVDLPVVQSATPVSTLIPTLKPDEWQNLPVVPEISPKVIEIFRRGQELGNNSVAFSKIGDCGSTPAWFLGDFDRGPRFYSLGEHTHLEAVIAAFQGSFDRTSLAARSGFNASALFTPLWADRSFCGSNESPLQCEYRVHRPSIALIMLGTNDIWHPEDFEPQMRRIIESSIDAGIIPVLSTKADNQEGDGSINATIAQLAHEYDVPLWNYWAAVQALPDGGLQEDGAHLTWGANRFDDPDSMKKAWPVRNLSALQILDAVWRTVQQ